MEKMSKEERKQIESKVYEIMKNAVSSDYVRYILEHEDDELRDTLMNNIIQNVLNTSAWYDEGYYNDDDIRLAIGRELMARLGIEV